jgi:hypothetical protein
MPGIKGPLDDEACTNGLVHARRQVVRLQFAKTIKISATQVPLPVFKVCHKLHMYEELAGQGSDQGVSPKEDLAVRLEYRM